MFDYRLPQDDYGIDYRGQKLISGIDSIKPELIADALRSGARVVSIAPGSEQNNNEITEKINNLAQGCEFIRQQLALCAEIKYRLATNQKITFDMLSDEESILMGSFISGQNSWTPFTIEFLDKIEKELQNKLSKNLETLRLVEHPIFNENTAISFQTVGANPQYITFQVTDLASIHVEKNEEGEQIFRCQYVGDNPDIQKLCLRINNQYWMDIRSSLFTKSQKLIADIEIAEQLKAKTINADNNNLNFQQAQGGFIHSENIGESPILISEPLSLKPGYRQVASRLDAWSLLRYVDQHKEFNQRFVFNLSFLLNNIYDGLVAIHKAGIFGIDVSLENIIISSDDIQGWRAVIAPSEATNLMFMSQNRLEDKAATAVDDFYAFRIMLLQVIATQLRVTLGNILNVSDQPIEAGQPLPESTPKEIAEFVKLNGNQAALTSYLINAQTLLNAAQDLDPTRRNNIQSMINSYQQYIANPPAEDQDSLFQETNKKLKTSGVEAQQKQEDELEQQSQKLRQLQTTYQLMVAHAKKTKDKPDSTLEVQDFVLIPKNYLENLKKQITELEQVITDEALKKSLSEFQQQINTDAEIWSQFDKKKELFIKEEVGILNITAVRNVNMYDTLIKKLESNPAEFSRVNLGQLLFYIQELKNVKTAYESTDQDLNRNVNYKLVIEKLERIKDKFKELKKNAKLKHPKYKILWEQYELIQGNPNYKRQNSPYYQFHTEAKRLITDRYDQQIERLLKEIKSKKSLSLSDLDRLLDIRIRKLENELKNVKTLLEKAQDPERLDVKTIIALATLNGSKIDQLDLANIEKLVKLMERLEATKQNLHKKREKLQASIKATSKTTEQATQKLGAITTQLASKPVVDPQEQPSYTVATNNLLHLLRIHEHDFQKEPKLGRKFVKRYAEAVDRMVLSLIALEKPLFAAVDLSHFYDKKGNKLWGPTLTAIADHETNVTAFVVNDILNRQNPEERALAMEFWINVAARALNNPQFKSLATASAINSALESSSIARLKATKARLSPEAAKKLADLHTLMTHDGSYKHMRTYIDRNPDAIPFMGLYQTDYTFARDGNKGAEVIGGFQKHYMGYRQLNKLKKYLANIKRQNLPSRTFSGIPDALRDAKHDESILFEASLRLESREQTTDAAVKTITTSSAQRTALTLYKELTRLRNKEKRRPADSRQEIVPPPAIKEEERDQYARRLFNNPEEISKEETAPRKAQALLYLLNHKNGEFFTNDPLVISKSDYQISDLAAEGQREPGKLYLAKEESGLKYEIIDMNGQLRKSTIPFAELPEGSPTELADYINNKDNQQILFTYLSQVAHIDLPSFKTPEERQYFYDNRIKLAMEFVSELTDAEFKDFQVEFQKVQNPPKTIVDHVTALNIKRPERPIFDKKPTKAELAAYLQEHVHSMSQYIKVGEKPGGANKPGAHGGVYEFEYVVKDKNGIETVYKQRLLFKQDTKGKHIHHDKIIAEYAGGLIKNALIGDSASWTIMVTSPGANLNGQPDPNGENIYIGSIFIDDFEEFHKKMEYEKRTPFFEALHKQEYIDALCRINDDGVYECRYDNYEEVMAACLLAGDFDIHSANLGSIPLPEGLVSDLEGEMVDIDHGGALRKLEDKVHIHSRSRHLPGQGPTNHFLDLPTSIKVTGRFADALERQSNVDLKPHIENIMGTVATYEGLEPIKEFAEHIGMPKEKVAAYKKQEDLVSDIEHYLIHKMHVRQDSFKELAAEIRLSLVLQKDEHGEFKFKDHTYIDKSGKKKTLSIHSLIDDDPEYFLRGDFHFRGDDQPDSLAEMVNQHVAKQIDSIIKSTPGIFNQLAKIELILANENLLAACGKQQTKKLKQTYHELLEHTALALTTSDKADYSIFTDRMYEEIRSEPFSENRVMIMNRWIACMQAALDAGNNEAAKAIFEVIKRPEITALERTLHGLSKAAKDALEKAERKFPEVVEQYQNKTVQPQDQFLNNSLEPKGITHSIELPKTSMNDFVFTKDQPLVDRELVEAYTKTRMKKDEAATSNSIQGLLDTLRETRATLESMMETYLPDDFAKMAKARDLMNPERGTHDEEKDSTILKISNGSIATSRYSAFATTATSPESRKKSPTSAPRNDSEYGSTNAKATTTANDSETAPKMRRKHVIPSSESE